MINDKNETDVVVFAEKGILYYRANGVTKFLMPQLRDYQIEIADKAAKILQEHGLVYLALETRTGKTLTAMQVALLHKSRSVLFVTKKKAIKSVESDYKNFGYHSLYDLKVINYESVSKCAGGYDLIIVDEAHSLGAFPKPAKRVKDLMKFTVGKPIIYLSGTPSPESFSQFFHQFYISSFSPFRQYRNFYKWAHDYVNIKKKYLYNRELNDYSDANITAIEKVISPLMLSFTQAQAGFKEELSERILMVDMGEKQQLIIDKLLKDRIVKGSSGAVVLGDTAVKMQSKIHQLSSGTVKDENGNFHIISYNKANYIKEYFAGKKIAVFYKFQAELDMLKDVFGGDCTESPEDFQKSDNLTFLGQFQSAREGIRLDTADAIVFFNIDFSALSYLQAKDRIISKERTKQAILYWVFSKGGIEEKIYKVVTKKKDYTSYHFKRDYHVRGSVSGKDN